MKRFLSPLLAALLFSLTALSEEYSTTDAPSSISEIGEPAFGPEVVEEPDESPASAAPHVESARLPDLLRPRPTNRL